MLHFHLDNGRLLPPRPKGQGLRKPKKDETVTRVGDADPVEHPAHYELSHPGLECIDLTAGMSFCMGNAVKYVWRYRSKNKPVED